MTDGGGQGHVTRFLKFLPSHIFGVGKTRHVKCLMSCGYKGVLVHE